jgi:hypothetical protein
VVVAPLPLLALLGPAMTVCLILASVQALAASHV